MVSLIDKDKNKAIDILTKTINTFETIYEKKWLNMMRDKLGLFGEDAKDQVLILDLLTWMHQNKADYTNTFCFLMNEKIQEDKAYKEENFLIWKKRWEKRLKINNNTKEKFIKLMRSNNPLIIPRNHKVEEAIIAADKNDLEPLIKLNKILSRPYASQKDIENYQVSDYPRNKDFKTFCGT